MNNPEEVTALENAFAEEVKKRGDDFKYFKSQFGEHPEDRANNEEFTDKLAGVTTLNEIYAAIKEKVPKFEPIRYCIILTPKIQGVPKRRPQVVGIVRKTGAFFWDTV